MTNPDRPINKQIWCVGADNGSTGYAIILEQSDGTFYPLFKIEPGGDATAVSMIIGSYTATPVLITEEDPRK